MTIMTKFVVFAVRLLTQIRYISAVQSVIGYTESIKMRKRQILRKNKF
ncbi:hypothetical protein ACFL2J_00175 [Candidatus Omnitrophota bacterium]